MPVSISPVFNGMQFFDNDGLPLSGGKLFQYEAGSTSVQRTSYADDSGTIPNSNPIVLDSSGRMTTDLWLTDGEAYNLILTLSDGTTVLTGVDDVIGVIASSATAGSTAIWVEILTPPTYVSPTQFLVAGNVTTSFAVGNRVQVEYTTNSFKYGTVSAVSYSSPNTQVTLINDSSAQNSGMTKVYWSLNQVTGRTVDAGAVTWNVPASYTTPLTVGYELNALNTDVTSLNTRVDSTYKVWTTTGGPTTFTITPSPAIASYTVGQIFVIKFNAAASGTPTINVNGLGAVGLKQYNSSGTKVVATSAVNQMTQISYDGTDFVVLDPLVAASTAAPRGQQVFTSNGTFTVPANVYSVKVTCVGGGGGGGTGITTGDIESGYVSSYGGSGGYGGSGISYLAVTPAAGHSVSIGAGGAGTNTTGGTGGSTTFGASLVVATGGAGGSASATGANGYGSVADYGYSGVGFKVGSSNKGTGGISGYGDGATGTAGTAGMCIVEW